MKKLTVDFIKTEFEKEKYELLTTVYKNCRQKLDYVCPEGHKHSIRWSGWKSGKRYPYCAKNIKLTIDFIRTEFEKEGYKLLTKKYKNAHQKLDCICPKEHKYVAMWNDWQQDKRCPYCYGNVKLTIDFIREEFKKENYILLTTEYRNNQQKLDYICSKGHKHSISWGNWRRGKRCPTCYRENHCGENHPSWKGGISCEPYCEVWVKKEFKEMIKERDDYQCQNPDCWCKNGRSGMLCIHHIDYVKKNCDPSNLITLCKSCNSRANKDRKHHTDFYKSIIKIKEGSIYDI